MGKKFLAVLLSVLLLLGVLPQVVYAAEADNSAMGADNEASEAGGDTSGTGNAAEEADMLALEEGSITRAEWLTELAGVFGFYVEEDNYPDNYFSDINAESDDYHIIMLAAEFGLLDVEAGEAVRPDEPATREFAAQTLNTCLGFQLEDGTEYSFSDQEATVYKADAQVALNRGWFLPSDGCFLPDRPITVTEEGAMLLDARAVLESAVVDENHQDTYQFAEDVIEIPKGTDVRIDEQDVVTVTGGGKDIACQL